MLHIMFNMKGKSGSTQEETPSKLREKPGAQTHSPRKNSSIEQSSALDSIRNPLAFWTSAAITTSKLLQNSEKIASHSSASTKGILEKLCKG